MELRGIMNYKKYAAIIISALCLTACGNNSAVSEETTIGSSESISAETNVETSENTSETTEEVPSTIEIMGQKYDTSGYIDCLTVDADTCFEVTEEDKNNIELLKNSGTYPWYLKVINCKDHDLGFLSELNDFSYAEFWDLEDSDLDYLSKFDKLKTVSFIDCNDDHNILIKTNVENTFVYAKNFDLQNGIVFVSAYSGDTAVYSSNDMYGDNLAPTDKPYVKASPCVKTYFEDGEPLDIAYVEDKLKENANTLTAYFCNPTDEEVTIGFISIYDAETDDWIPTANGESYIPIKESVAPNEEYRIELTKDMYDLSTINNGAYKVVFNYGDDVQESTSAYFILKNSEENDELKSLDGEQRAVFEKALSYVKEYFGCSHYMTEEYASTHTADEFIGQFLDAFTYDCAYRFAQTYIDENGDLYAFEGDRGSDITNVETTFYTNRNIDPATGYDKINIISVTAKNDCDISYRTWLECGKISMIKTPDGWRVDKFTLWW